MKHLGLWIGLVFIAPSAFAAKIIGNGGDVVVCEKRTPPIQLLDFYEAAKLSDLKLVDPEGHTYLEKVNSLANRISKRFPALARTILADVDVFEKRKKIMDDVELKDIDDSHHTVLPPHCQIAQIANQKAPLFPRHPWFIIDAALWAGLDETNKAGLVIHEIIYRQGLRYGLEHSMGVRYLVGLLFSTEMDSITDREWIQTLLNSLSKYYEIGGLRIPLFSGEQSFCEARPGTTSCRDLPPVTLARFKYQDDRLTEIDFENPERIEFSNEQLNASILTRNARFEVENGRQLMEFEGRMTVSPARGTSSTFTFDVHGKLDAKAGTFCGTKTLVDMSGRPSGSAQSSCGAIEVML